MVIDSSAIIAVIFGELDAGFFAQQIEDSFDSIVSAVSLLESSLVVGARKHRAGLIELDMLIADGNIRVVAFDAEQSQLARAAWECYGKGRHPAALNLGDCCSYALAKATGQPLLYKGDDFAKTDIAGITAPKQDQQ